MSRFLVDVCVCDLCRKRVEREGEPDPLPAGWVWLESGAELACDECAAAPAVDWDSYEPNTYGGT